MNSLGKNFFLEPLSADEENEYIQIYFNGNEIDKENARNVLIERNLRLVAHVVKKYTTPSFCAEDLISIGTIGLIKAVSTFKEEKGNKLSTYAVRCIENEILMYMRSGKKYLNEVSMNEPVGTDKEGNEIVIMDLIYDDKDEINTIDKKMQYSAILDLMEKILTPKEKEVLSLRYGFNQNGKISEELTQKEVGHIMKCSRSYISRLEKRAVEKIKASMSDCFF